MKRMRSMVRCTVMLCITACSFGPSSEEKSEASRVSRAVELLRDAPNDQKPPLLDALRALSCSLPDVCKLQKTCVGAYEVHVRALQRTQKARAGLGDAPPEVAAEALRDLERAKRELAEAEPSTRRCADEQGIIRRHYKF